MAGKADDGRIANLHIHDQMLPHRGELTSTADPCQLQDIMHDQACLSLVLSLQHVCDETAYGAFCCKGGVSLPHWSSKARRKLSFHD